MFKPSDYLSKPIRSHPKRSPNKAYPDAESFFFDNTCTLPCFSIVATGACTYGKRCHFKHDYRCINLNIDTRKIDRKSNKPFKDTGHALFFWPAQSYQSETYEVSDNVILQSMWHHYLLSLSPNNMFDEKEYTYNFITKKRRLEVFQNLSKNRLPIFADLSRGHNPSG